MKQLRGFASDNNASVHPEILAAISQANVGHTVGYGDDVITEQAQKIFKQCFGQQTETFFIIHTRFQFQESNLFREERTMVALCLLLYKLHK
jgi:hypothetical protein